MAVTFGQMTDRILRETARDISMEAGVQDAIVTAIKELEREQYWLFEKETDLTLSEGVDNVLLPNDFAELSTLRLNNNGTYRTQMFGFTPVNNHEIFDYARQPVSGLPYMWALFANKIYVYPVPDGEYILNMHYYYKDIVYPSLYADTSLWLGDLTEDLTRYKALSIFYRDSLQAEEKALFYEQKANTSIGNMRIRNNQRLQINKLSI